MSQEITTPYNHQVSTLGEATGVDLEQLEKKVNDFVNNEILGNSDEKSEISGKVSAVVEQFENRFSKRELAILVGEKTRKEIEEQFNPMAKLAKLLGKK